MAELRATPMSNPIMGLLADRLKKVQQFGAKPFGYENPPVEMLMNLLGVPAVQQTMERMAYGEPLTTGRGMTTKPRAEAVEAAMTVAPVAGLLGKATKGLPVGASIKNVGDDLLSYRGSHTAPDADFGAPLYDLTGGGQMYPADIYSSKAAQIYGGGVPYDQKAFSIAQQYKDKPNALVTIYRAVPKDISNSEKLATLEKQMAAYMKRGTLPKDADNYSSGSKWYDAAYEKREQLRKMPDEPTNDINAINAGDWVTLTREYAKDHGESALKGEYKIISKKVKAKEVFTNADSIHEFGYQPQVAKPIQAVAPQQEALDTAQEGLLATQSEQPMQGLLQSKIPSPSSLTMPDVPTIEQMQNYGRTEVVPLSKVVSFQSARTWDKFNKGEHAGDLVQGFGDKPLALRLENGEYVIYDGNHRTDLAMQAGKTELPMNVIDVRSYDPTHAGRRPVPPKMSDDELLRSLLE